ncbi:MAG: hypothetical protein MMC33_000032 [Icmadophila ericetorum]|nr:hypothetical protein [Icmadophila ericetorum]
MAIAYRSFDYGVLRKALSPIFEVSPSIEEYYGPKSSHGDGQAMQLNNLSDNKPRDHDQRTDSLAKDYADDHGRVIKPRPAHKKIKRGSLTLNRRARRLARRGGNYRIATHGNKLSLYSGFVHFGIFGGELMAGLEKMSRSTNCTIKWIGETMQQIAVLVGAAIGGTILDILAFMFTILAPALLELQAVANVSSKQSSVTN